MFDPGQYYSEIDENTEGRWGILFCFTWVCLYGRGDNYQHEVYDLESDRGGCDHGCVSPLIR